MPHSTSPVAGLHIGTDVSKDRLEVALSPEEPILALDNTLAGWAELGERLKGHPVAAIGLEASGGAGSGASCSRPATRCASSTPCGYASSPGRWASWPRTTGSMPA